MSAKDRSRHLLSGCENLNVFDFELSADQIDQLGQAYRATLEIAHPTPICMESVSCANSQFAYSRRHQRAFALCWRGSLRHKWKGHMERPITDEDIIKFLRLNKANYASQIELMQAAVQLLWPYGPPTAAGQRIARLVMQELNSYSESPPRIGTGPLSQTNPLV